MVRDDLKHHGKNLRAIRLLRGMKQHTFAKEIGIAQQNVSKMEKKKEISDKQLEQAAKILNTTVDMLKNFDEKAVFQTNIINENQVNNFNPIKEVIEYFEAKLGQRDREMEELRIELNKLKGVNTQESSTGGADVHVEKDGKMKAV